MSKNWLLIIALSTLTLISYLQPVPSAAPVVAAAFTPTSAIATRAARN